MNTVVVDYSKGNLRSVQKSLELAGACAVISARVEDIYAADALVLPGVGSFADASTTMLANGQMQALRKKLAQDTPFLGICLGMQLLFERGNEGMPQGAWADGLGFLEGTCERLEASDETGQHFKIPHVGWNQVDYTFQGAGTASGAVLFEGIDTGENFYFTHSYQCKVMHPVDILATTAHAQVFPSAVQRGKVFGVQFHPEKSSGKGLALIRNFVRLALE